MKGRLVKKKEEARRFYLNKVRTLLPPEKKEKLKELRRKEKTLERNSRWGQLDVVRLKIDLLKAPTFDRWLSKAQQSEVLKVAKSHEFQNISPEEYGEALMAVYLNEALRKAPQFEELFRKSYTKLLQSDKSVFLKVMLQSCNQDCSKLFENFKNYLYWKGIVKCWSPPEPIDYSVFRNSLANWFYCELVRRGETNSRNFPVDIFTSRRQERASYGFTYKNYRNNSVGSYSSRSLN